MSTPCAPQLLSVEQVAERLAVSTRTVRRWNAAGTLPAYRLPSGAIRIQEQDVAALAVPATTPGRRPAVSFWKIAAVS